MVNASQSVKIEDLHAACQTLRKTVGKNVSFLSTLNIYRVTKTLAERENTESTFFASCFRQTQQEARTGGTRCGRRKGGDSWRTGDYWLPMSCNKKEGDRWVDL